MAVVSRLLPYLHSKSTDTRVAASSALQQICSLVPIWKPRTPPSTPRDGQSPSTSTPAEPPFPPFVLEDLLFSPNLLLASSGKEFAKPLQSDKDLAAARQEAMKRMGLGFFEDVSGDGFTKDLEKELADDDDLDVKMSDANKTDQEGSEPPPTPAVTTVKMEVDIPTPPSSAEPHRERLRPPGPHLGFGWSILMEALQPSPLRQGLRMARPPIKSSSTLRRVVKSPRTINPPRPLRSTPKKVTGYGIAWRRSSKLIWSVQIGKSDMALDWLSATS